MSGIEARRDARAKTPELAGIFAAVCAVAAVLAAGMTLTALLPDPDIWQIAAAFLAPAGLAFAIHWWNAQKL